VFEQMQTQGCTPDVVTYTALISAFERAGQWQMALRAFQQMCIQGCRPDAIVYNAIIDTLWETGVSWAQQKALQLFQTAVKQLHFQQQPISCKGSCAEINLHAMTAGVAMLSLYSWMQDIRCAALHLPTFIGTAAFWHLRGACGLGLWRTLQGYSVVVL
jgi:pentatricopeptide repeat domain-containing protein 1